MQVSEQSIVFIVIIVTCSLFIAAAALLTYVRMYNERKKKHSEEKRIMSVEFDKQLMQSQLETQEETMGILSRELHDNIGQLLNSTKLLIGVTQRGLADPPDTLVTANETLGLAIQELRSLSKSLDKEWLSQFNFIENLEAEINRINSSRTLHVFLTRPDTLPLKPNEQIILFRIVQELIQNAIKHAQAQHFYIKITKYPGKLQLTLSDDGTGFDPEAVKEGMGLRNIRHRTHLLGGSVQWKSAGFKGTVVLIELPVNQAVS
jgi:signal transduction histidine kinase